MTQGSIDWLSLTDAQLETQVKSLGLDPVGPRFVLLDRVAKHLNIKLTDSKTKKRRKKAKEQVEFLF